MADPIRGQDLVAVGSAIVDRYYRLSNLPEPDGGAFVHEEWVGFGGVAANVACATSALGRDVGIIARLGADGDADRVEADLREWGVAVDRLQRGDERSTYSMVFRGPDGRRMIMTGGEAAKSLTINAADEAYARDGRVVFTNGYVPDRVTRPLVRARANSELSSLAFDLSGPLEELEGRGTTAVGIDRAVAECDLFVADRIALESYCAHHGRPDASFDQALDLLEDLGVGRTALTRGEDGALLRTADGDRLEIPAFDVTVVDETGASDAFIAGLIDAWLLDDRPPEIAGRHAAAVAALNCTGDGARGGLPTPGELAAFLESR